MQADLEAVASLWQADKHIDDARDALAALDAGVVAAEAATASAEAALQLVDKAYAETLRAEQGLQGRAEEYTTKRDRTRALIDQGQAPDYDAAARQLAQCAAIVDETETALLETMEKREVLEASRAKGRKTVEAARQSIAAAKARRDEETPGHRSVIAHWQPLRDERWPALGTSDQTRYLDLRKKKRAVLANLVDGACRACHVEAPPQVQNEVFSGKRTHVCRGCGRWFLHVSD